MTKQTNRTKKIAIFLDIPGLARSRAIPTLPLNFLKIAFLPNNDGHQTHIASIIFCTYKSECRDGCL